MEPPLTTHGERAGPSSDSWVSVPTSTTTACKAFTFSRFDDDTLESVCQCGVPKKDHPNNDSDSDSDSDCGGAGGAVAGLTLEASTERGSGSSSSDGSSSDAENTHDTANAGGGVTLHLGAVTAVQKQQRSQQHPRSHGGGGGGVGDFTPPPNITMSGVDRAESALAHTLAKTMDDDDFEKKLQQQEDPFTSITVCGPRSVPTAVTGSTAAAQPHWSAVGGQLQQQQHPQQKAALPPPASPAPPMALPVPRIALTERDIRPAPIDARLLLEQIRKNHSGASGSQGRDCVFFVGNSGGGKSTTINYLFGAVRFEIYQETHEVNGRKKFKEVLAPVAGHTVIAPIGKTGVACTRALQSVELGACGSGGGDGGGMVAFDTPGFGDTGFKGATEVERRTIDAANATGIARTVREAGSARIVLLINVNDELSNVRATAMQALFDLMGTFIADVAAHMPSVLVLFTHVGECTVDDISDMLWTLGEARLLTPQAEAFRAHAKQLLDHHRDALLVHPAAADADARRDQLLGVLGAMPPIDDTEAALRCPISDAVRTALELHCAELRSTSMHRLQSEGKSFKCVAPGLADLSLLNEELRLPSTEDAYRSTVRDVLAHGMKRLAHAMECLGKKEFSEMRDALSIFKDAASIAPFTREVCDGADLYDTVQQDAVGGINAACVKLDAELRAALATDDVSAAAASLVDLAGMHEHLKEKLLMPNRVMATTEAVGAARTRTEQNLAAAKQLVRNLDFGAELGALLGVVKRSAGCAELQRFFLLDGGDGAPAGDYDELGCTLEDALVGVAQSAAFEDAQHSFVVHLSTTKDALAQLDAAHEHLGAHVPSAAADARKECRAALAALKARTLGDLSDATERGAWRDASVLVNAVDGAAELGAAPEKLEVTQQLERAKGALCHSVRALIDLATSALEREDFAPCVEHATALDDATHQLARVVPAEALAEFAQAHTALQESLDARGAQLAESVTRALAEHAYSEVVDALSVLERMGAALVGSVVPRLPAHCAEVLRAVRCHADEENAQCVTLALTLLRVAAQPAADDLAQLATWLQQAQLRRTAYRDGLRGKVPTLGSFAGEGDGAWDTDLEAAHDVACAQLRDTAIEYTEACAARCASSLAATHPDEKLGSGEAAPKPNAKDVAAFLATLAECARLGFDGFFGGGAADPPFFAATRAAVVAQAKGTVTELRDASMLSMRTNNMTDAATHRAAIEEMLVLRAEFEGDAVTIDSMYAEIGADYAQQAGAFKQAFDDALRKCDVHEIRKLLRGFQMSRSPVEKAQFEDAIAALTAECDSRYDECVGVITSIPEDEFSELPPTIAALPANLKVLESVCQLDSDVVLPDAALNEAAAAAEAAAINAEEAAIAAAAMENTADATLQLSERHAAASPSSMQRRRSTRGQKKQQQQQQQQQQPPLPLPPSQPTKGGSWSISGIISSAVSLGDAAIFGGELGDAATFAHHAANTCALAATPDTHPPSIASVPAQLADARRARDERTADRKRAAEVATAARTAATDAAAAAAAAAAAPAPPSLLPAERYTKWCAPQAMLCAKFKQLAGRTSMLETGWRFWAVEKTFCKFQELSTLGFPPRVGSAIESARVSVSEAIISKAALLGSDLHSVLAEPDALAVDLIYDEVSKAHTNNSRFITFVEVRKLNSVMAQELGTQVQAVRDRLADYDIRGARELREKLYTLQQDSTVASKKLERPLKDLDKNEEQRKAKMFTHKWLSGKDTENRIEKHHAFRDAEPTEYEGKLLESMECLRKDIAALRRDKVETAAGVTDLLALVRRVPLFARYFSEEKDVLAKHANDLWHSFKVSLEKGWWKAKNEVTGAELQHELQFLAEALKVLLGVRDNAAAYGADPPPYAPQELARWILQLSSVIEDGKAFRNPEKLNEINNNWKTHIVGGTLEGFEADGATPKTTVVPGISFTVEEQNFEATLEFLLFLKQNASDVQGLFGKRKQAPAVPRAIATLRTRAAQATKELDGMVTTPAKAALVVCNFRSVSRAIENMVEDEELRSAMLDAVLEHSTAAEAWLGVMEQRLSAVSKRAYNDAKRAQRSAAEREKFGTVVRMRMEQHGDLLDHFEQRGLRAKPKDGEAADDTALVADIKADTTSEVAAVLTKLADGRLDAHDVAEQLHASWDVSNMVVNDSITAHAQGAMCKLLCEAERLKAAKRISFGVEELFDQLLQPGGYARGGEIVEALEPFKDLAEQRWQAQFEGKTIESTVEELALANQLDADRAASLLQACTEVGAVYDGHMQTAKRGGWRADDMPGLVARICSNKGDLPALVGGVFAVWSLSGISEHRKTPRQPLKAQIAAIVRLLELDIVPTGGLRRFAYKAHSWATGKRAVDSSHLAQIATGQGKSVVLGVLSTVLAAGLDLRADCVCYTEYLSRRDYEDFKHVFAHFGVKAQLMADPEHAPGTAMVQYGTFQQLSECLINEHGDVRELTRKAIMGAAGVGCGSGGAVTRVRKKKKTSAKGGKALRAAEAPKRVLLVDEVDVFFSKDFFGQTHNPVLSLQLDEVAAMQRKAWEMRNDPGGAAAIFEVLVASASYSSLMGRFGGVKALIDGQLRKMLRDLETATAPAAAEPFRDYKLVGGKIAYKSHACYDDKVTFDYVTLWQYFKERAARPQCDALDAALKTHLGLSIKCGQFSFAECPKSYALILGVTGTLLPEAPGGQHPLCAFERSIISDTYNIKGVTDMPSVYGCKRDRITFLEAQHVKVRPTETDWMVQIGLEIELARAGRAVLIYFESDEKLRAYLASNYGQQHPRGLVDTIMVDAKNVTARVRKATQSGSVTLLSRELGRGLDFHCSDATVEALGGLHVVQTFLSEALSEEIQIRGRTARQKNSGSFQMVLLAADLKKFSVSNTDLEAKARGEYVPVLAPVVLGGTPAPKGEGATPAPPRGSCPSAPSKLPRGVSLAASASAELIGDDSSGNGGGGAAAAAAPTARATLHASVTQTLYAFLHGRREIYLEKQTRGRQEAAQGALQKHQATLGYRDDLVRALDGSAPAHARCVGFLGEHNIHRAKCRLVLLTDATASMSSTWTRCTRSINTALERVSAISGGGGNIELKLIAYRDYELERSRLLEASEWTDDPASLVNFVNGVQCISEYGCDWPEAVEAGLHLINQDKEPPTRVLLIADAEPHAERKGEPIASLRFTASHARASGNKKGACSVHASHKAAGGLVEGGVLQTDYRLECAKLASKGVKVFPLTIDGCETDAFDEIATITGGESRPFDPDDADALIHAMAEGSLEDIGGADMVDEYRAQYRS